MLSLQLGYQIALIALTSLVILNGSGAMRRTIITVFGVMVAAWFLRGSWPSVEYSLAMIAVDSAALAVITWHPAGRWQSIIGLSYVLQVSVHIGRIASGENADINSFYWGLSAIAILQLLLLWGWWINGRVDRHRFRRRFASAASTASPEGMVR